MGGLMKLFFILGPLAAQGILQVQHSMGVTHDTIAGQIAGWILATTLSARALTSQENKNIVPPER